MLIQKVLNHWHCVALVSYDVGCNIVLSSQIWMSAMSFLIMRTLVVICRLRLQEESYCLDFFLMYIKLTVWNVRCEFEPNVDIWKGHSCYKHII